MDNPVFQVQKQFQFLQSIYLSTLWNFILETPRVKFHVRNVPIYRAGLKYFGALG